MVLLASNNLELFPIVLIGLIIIGLGSILRYFKQPYVIAYILAGVLLGKHGFEIVVDDSFIKSLGEFGLILLLFFIGMEISLPQFLEKWKIAVFGTIAQIMASILFVSLIGHYFDWPINRTIIMGFVISLSSSAVIIKLLEDNNETKSKTGRNVISILLMQDILMYRC